MTTLSQPTAARAELTRTGAVVLVLMVMLLVSCSSRDTGPPRAAAEELMRALFAGDAAAVADVAPALDPGAPGATGSTDLDAIFDAVGDFSDWSIDEVSRDGDSAVARVTLTAEERTAEIVLPLSLEDGAWLVDERISVSTTLDFVPLE